MFDILLCPKFMLQKVKNQSFPVLTYPVIPYLHPAMSFLSHFSIRLNDYVDLLAHFSPYRVAVERYGYSVIFINAIGSTTGTKGNRGMYGIAIFPIICDKFYV